MREGLFVGVIVAFMIGCGWLMEIMVDSGEYEMVCASMFDEEQCVLVPYK